MIHTLAALVVASSLAAPALGATGDNIVAVTKPDIRVQEAVNFAAGYVVAVSNGLEATAPCYRTITRDDIRALVQAATWEQLTSDNEAITNSLRTTAGTYGSAHYLAVLFVGNVGAKFVIGVTLVDARNARRVASAERVVDRLEGATDLFEALGRELGPKLPCVIEITGKRQVDLEKIANANDTAFAPDLALFQAMVPMVMGADPKFSGHVTQTDTLSWPVTLGADGALAGSAKWTSTIDEPVVTMSSPEMDVVTKRAPYTLTFDGKDVSGTYDKASSAASYSLELLDRGVATGGAGEGTVTLKDQLKALGPDLINGLQAFGDALGVGDQMRQAQQQGLAAANAPPGFDPHSATNSTPIPTPGQTDSAYFRLKFDLRLRDDDEKPVSGSDSLGGYDYTVRIVRQ